MSRIPNPELREFILRNVTAHPIDIGQLTAKKFEVSRATVNNNIRKLEDDGLISAEGKTRARKYKLKPIFSVVESIPITSDISEDIVWRKYILPDMANVPPRITEICQYGFTEMFNNVIDHSESKDSFFWYERDYLKIKIGIVDNGVGIFEKIKKSFNLLDERHAILELSKGKLTSDPDNHTGEGIFFTSRMFDTFLIDSRNLTYGRRRKHGTDWLIEIRPSDEETDGTMVVMEIPLDTTWTYKEVFDQYVDDANRFSKTHIALTLARYEGEQLVSRSQARRLMARVEPFSEVFLDFTDVPTVGQAFTDEIFRVFVRDHPNIHVYPMNTTPEIERMIAHARANAEDVARSSLLRSDDTPS
jgi:anti-sigma regulatory factor (Ser/Thr protein kinase)